MKQTGIATLALLLALNVALGTILGAGMKAYAADTYGLHVGDTEITSEQLTVKSEYGTATYDPKTHTLTLNNYKYNGDGYDDNPNSDVFGEGGGIDYRGDADLLIILQGSNSITKSATSKLNYSHGIYFHVNGHTLTISGDGTLDISFAETTSGIEKRNGIFCEPGAFVMESGTVTTSGGTANESAGIYATDGITINGGTFTGIGNPTTNYESRGIYTPNGTTINGGKVTAQATNNTNEARAFDGSVTINGGTVTAQATSDTNEARAFDGSVTINGGTVTASASSKGKAEAFFMNSCNISVASELLDMKVGDSAETAKATTNTGDVYEKKYVYIKVNEAEDINPTVSITGWIYGEYSETANAPSVTGNTGNGTVTYSYKVKGAEDSTYTSTVPTDAGDYTVQASIAAAGKYKAGSATADFTVSKADPTIKAPTTQELSYTGTAQALVTAGTTTGGTMVYALGTSTAATNDYSASIPTATDEGTYYVWYKVLGDTNYKDSAPAVVSVTMTLTRYTITYEMNGGSNSENNPSSYTMKSKDITLSSLAARNGYTFIGWTGSNGTTPSTSVTIPSGSSGNKSYTANWQKIPYKISFDLNGGELGEGQTNPTNYDVESLQFSPNVPTRKGYNFEGWLLSGDATGTVSKDLTISTGTTGNREYIAQWKLNVYTLSYTLDGGTASPDNPTGYTVNSDDFTLTNPTKKGYTFAGWTGTDVDVNTSKDVKISQGSTGNRDYVAKWTLNVYTLSYTLNGGTVTPNNPTSYTVESDDFTLTKPTKTGYTFAGWTGTSVDVTASKDVKIAQGSIGNREYVAKWTLNVYALSYDLQGGIASPDNPTSYTIESADIKLTRPTKQGYDFTGWSFDAEISLDVTLPKGSTGDRNYVATWGIITYTISYDLQGGNVSGTNPTSYNCEANTFKLTTPTRTGYTFAGWTGTGITGTSTDVTIPTGSTGNREYTATWTAVEYTISYTLNNGSVSGNPDKYTIESEAITLNNPTKNGYQFEGWTGTDLNGKTQTVIISKGSTGNREYTANFSPITYTLTYDLNGGSVTTANPTSYDIETATFTLTQPTKTGYSFEGWTGTGLTGATKVVTIAVNSTGNRSYKANWTLIQYDVSLI